MKSKTSNLLGPALRDYFADHLPRLRGLSPNTIQSYRDSLVLLLRFVACDCKCTVADLNLTDIDTERVLAFLSYLERDRKNGVTTRNVRLSAIHAFFRYVGTRHPDQLELIQQIMGIPFKRALQKAVEYLEYEEIDAVLSAIDQKVFAGRRDYALLTTMFNTAARAQEIVDLSARDLQLTRPFQVRIFGKGRKERFCPLWPQTAQTLRAFAKERNLDLRSDAKIFLNHRGEALTRFGIRYILAKYLGRACAHVPSLAKKRLHPHSMRHSAAIALLKSGVDLSSISQWLGHASLNTTNRYATVDLEMKRKAIARVKTIPRSSRAPWKNHTILEWLESL
ncbi:MAG: integrase [Acidobacteria bacterium]|nr:MAG: integrase [Acidobacteriota bacterium]PYT79775.1 MAG: integrase [Acidobacteriota bacterium]